MTKLCYILCDGYGGILLRNGYVNHLSKNNQQVLLIIYEYHKDTINYMFKHLNNIIYEYVCFEFSKEENEIKKTLKKDENMLGYWINHFQNKYKDFTFIPENWYYTALNEIRSKFSDFKVYRNIDNEDIIYNNYIKNASAEYILYQNCQKNKEFSSIMHSSAFVNGKELSYNDKYFSKSSFKEYRRDLVIDSKYLDNSLKCINLHNLSKNMIDTYKLLNNSKELHLVPGPYALLVRFLIDIDKDFLKNTKIYFHKYIRPYYPFMKDILNCKKLIIKN
jgi:hypothetical protein